MGRLPPARTLARLLLFAIGVSAAGFVAASLFVEARYQSQVWELDTPLPVRRFRSNKDVDALVEAFHTVHDRVYAVVDEGSQVECVNWRGRLSIALNAPPKAERRRPRANTPRPVAKRPAYFGDGRAVQTPIFKGDMLRPGDRIVGPAIIEEATTTIVVHPKMTARVSPAANYILEGT